MQQNTVVWQYVLPALLIFLPSFISVILNARKTGAERDNASSAAIKSVAEAVQILVDPLKEEVIGLRKIIEQKESKNRQLANRIKVLELEIAQMKKGKEV